MPFLVFMEININFDNSTYSAINNVQLMKTKQEIKDMLKRIKFNSKNEVDEVARFLKGIGLQPKQEDEGGVNRELTTARFFITCVTQHVFPNKMPLGMVVDLGIQIYNLCTESEQSKPTIVSSEDSGVVMAGERMGIYRNGFAHVCDASGSITILLSTPCRAVRFSVGELINAPETGKTYQVTIPDTKSPDYDIICPGTYYMLYVGDKYWLLADDIYYDVTSVHGVEIRVLEEVK